jgi:predicted amidohydrolase
VTTSALRLALAQISVVGGQLDTNLARAIAVIGTAAESGAEVVILPECMDLGWTHPSARDLAAPIPDGPACQLLMQASREHGIHVSAGLTEQSGQAIYNAAVLIDEQGKLLALHRKINELDIAHDLYATGDRLTVVPTAFGTVGIMICADGRADQAALTRSLGYMGADIILSPSA